VFFNCTVVRDSWCAVGLPSVLHNNAYQQTTIMDCIFALFINENNDTVEEWLYYYGAFGTIVMIKFEMIMSRCRAKSEG
jgi:hypothetical protein